MRLYSQATPSPLRAYTEADAFDADVLLARLAQLS
jgi:hypothetical protein